MFKSFSEILNWYGLIDEGIILCKDGSLLCGWYLKGIDTEPMDDEAVLGHTQHLANSIKDFGNEDAFWVDLARRPLKTYKTTEKEFIPEILQIFEKERADFFENNTNYSNLITLCYQWQPPKALILEDKKNLIEEALKLFKDRRDLVEQRFQSLFKLQKMGKRTDIDDHHEIEMHRDELLGRIASSLEGRFRKVNIPKIPVYLDVILCPEWSHEKPKSLPIMNGKPVAIISIDGYPNVAYPEVLACLEAMPLEYQWTTRFLPYKKTTAENKIKTKQRAWNFSKSDLKSQFSRDGVEITSMFAQNLADEAEDALQNLDAGELSFGEFTSVITIFGNQDDEKIIKAAATFIIENLGQQGFSARLETFNALEAYISSLPGHRKENARRGILSSYNFTDLIPISTIWSGEVTNPNPLFPQNSPPLIQAVSITGEPYFFNLHTDDVGHTLVFGPTGSGKSVLLNLITSNFLKYAHAQVFCFDKKMSMYALTNAVGGKHYNIGEFSISHKGFNPLGDIEKLGLVWATNWIKNICILNSLDVSPSMETEITNCLDNVKGSQTPLDDFAALVQNHSIKEVFKKYVKGGVYNNVLNATADELYLSDFTTFECDNLIEQGLDTAIPVIDYIFETIENKLTGKPSIIVFDEAWSFLGHEIFNSRIETWLRELRKKNCSIVLATQHVHDIKNDIGNSLVQSCKTRIFLADPEANSINISKKYSELGLTETQIKVLSKLKPKKDYYVIKPEGRRVVDFTIQPKALKILGMTDTQSIKEIQKIDKSNDNWWKNIIEETENDQV